MQGAVGMQKKGLFLTIWTRIMEKVKVWSRNEKSFSTEKKEVGAPS